MKIKEYHDKDLLPFSEICRKVAQKENFAFARFGDGEFYAMCGKEGCNCDNHFYYPDMGNELCKSFRKFVFNPYIDCYVGLHMSPRNGAETCDWLNEHNINPDQFKFAQNAVFHDALIQKGGTDIFNFYEACKKRKVVIIGPAHLKRQKKIILRRFIECPKTNSWKATDSVLAMAKKTIQKDDVVLLCVGPPAPVWIDRLLDHFGKEVTLIDFGSTLDPASGVKSRSFHEQIKNDDGTG